MKNAYRSLRELLESNWYEIPAYQRTYSWTERQRRDLFSDIENLLRPGEELRSHFMATIACLGPKTLGPDDVPGGTASEEAKPPVRATVTVVDGQQRITTLVILLKAIEKRLRAKVSVSEDGERAAEAAARLGKLLYDDEQGREILLQANHENERLLRDYLRDGTIPAESDEEMAADACFRAACLESEAFVEGASGADEPDDVQRSRLHALLSTIEDRLTFIYLELEDHASVYRVFETINSRGLVVDALDKSKSILMGIAASRTSGPDQERMVTGLHKTWASIYRAIGVTEVNGEEVLRFAATLLGPSEHSRVLSAADSIEQLRRDCADGKLGRLHRITDFLREVATALRELGSARRDLARVAHARILFVAIRIAKGLTESEREHLLEQWERVTFRIFGMCRKDARTGRGSYTQLACKIYHARGATADAAPAAPLSAAEISRRIRDLAGSDHSIENATRTMRAQDWYDRESYLRYLLYRYEEHLAGKGISRDTWRLIWRDSASRTIEHVFPQDPEEGWSPRMDSEAAKKLASRLGNLAILPQTVNSAASNRSFEKKKEIYKKNGALGLQHISDIWNEERWGPEEIAKREEMIVAFATARWADLPDEPAGTRAIA